LERNTGFKPATFALARPDEDVQADATRVNPAESFAPPCPSGEPVVSADAAKSCPFTDAGLARPKRSLPPSIAAIPDDRLLTVADICALLQIRKSVVYRACDRSDLEYVKSRVPRGDRTHDLRHRCLRAKSVPSGLPSGVACSNRRFDAARFLLERGADPESRSKLGFTPLTTGMIDADRRLIALLLDHGADPDGPGPEGPDAFDARGNARLRRARPSVARTGRLAGPGARGRFEALSMALGVDAQRAAHLLLTMSSVNSARRAE
jgi:hypothetical protein